MQEESQDDIKDAEGESPGCSTSGPSEETKERTESQERKDDQGAKKMKKNRCAICRKKVGLTGEYVKKRLFTSVFEFNSLNAM
ncbi:hypothetical protein J6590_046275 [Homalodisca vitripennis]|nr:hypothetical protein J6590_046275 [Homalodisca vitripennis]